MATPISDSGTAVFIDTNLDTHLALTVSDHDTVSDLKNLIMSEHLSCFPQIGQIQIHGIKIKRNSHYYHLTDSMVLRSAFIGGWFLSVDVANSRPNEKLLPHGSLHQVESIVIANNALVGSGRINNEIPRGAIKDDGNVGVEKSPMCVQTGKKRKKSRKKIEDTVGGDNSKEEIPSDRPCVAEQIVKNLAVVPSLNIECEVDGPGGGNKDVRNVCEEESSISVPSAKRKKKSIKKNEATVGDDKSKDNTAAVDNPVHGEKAVNNFLEMVVNSHIVCEEGTSIPAPNAKKKESSKSKKKNEDDSIVCEEGTSKSAKKKNCSKSKEKKESNDNNTQNGVNSESVKEASELESPLKNKPAKRKGSVSETVVAKVTVCEVDDSIVFDKGNSKPIQSAKKKHKSVTTTEDTVVVPVQQDIVFVANNAQNTDKEVMKKTEVLKEHRIKQSTNNNTENGVDSVSVKEASELKSPLKKKPKKRKRSLSHTSVSENVGAKSICEVDGSNKGIKGDSTVFDKYTTIQKDEAQIVDGARQERKECEDIMEIGTDAFKGSLQSTTKVTNNYNKQSDIEMEVQPSDVNDPKDLMEDNENAVVGHCHENEVGQIEGAAEGEVSPQNEDMNGMKEPVKQVKEQKGIQKGNAKTQKSRLNQTEGWMVMEQEEIQGTVLSVTEEGADFTADNADFLKQTKTKSNAENVEEQVSKSPKKKPTNKQSSTSKCTSDMLPNAHKTRQVAKFSSRSNSAMSFIVENRKPRDNASGKSMDLEKQREHIRISKAKHEGSNKMVQNKARKASGNNDMEVVSKSQQNMSLFEGEIFKDDSSSSSKDEVQDKVDNSDARTRTPSDNSPTSYLDGHDSPGVDSKQNGSHDGKRLENDERSPLKASLSGSTKMSLECVIRRSTRYRKAKMAASQLDELEVVPDSQGLPQM